MIDKGQWREFGQDTRVTPLLFTRSVMGFLMTTEFNLGPRFKISSEGLCFFTVSCPLHYTGVLGPTQTEDPHRAPPAGLTNTSSSSNLVFTRGLPSRYWPAQPCLASLGNQSWAAGWYGCLINRKLKRTAFICKINIWQHYKCIYCHFWII